MYKEYFQKSNKVSFAVFGDMMLDKYIIGHSSKLSLEAPVPIVKVDSEKHVLGGSGNVISNLYGLGINIIPFGLIGDDPNGKLIIDLLNYYNCGVDNIFYKEGTTVKTRLIANNQQIARIDWESPILNPDTFDKYHECINKSLNKVNGIIISDYDKGFCHHELIQYIIEKSKQLSLPIFIDPKGDDFDKYRGATLIKPNQYEAQIVTPFKLVSDKDYVDSAEWIRENFDIDTCIITRGAEGMIYSTNDFTEKIEIVAKKVYDVSGAGDTVIATLASCICLGIDPFVATKIANIAAGIVVSYPGTYPINKDLLNKTIENNINS